MTPDESSQDTEAKGSTEALISGMLSLAVPLWVERVRGYSDEHLRRRQKACSETIAYRGDVLQYGSKKDGIAAEAFNHLAEGIAILALLADGGVEAFGVRYDYPLEIKK